MLKGILSPTISEMNSKFNMYLTVKLLRHCIKKNMEFIYENEEGKIEIFQNVPSTIFGHILHLQPC